MGEHIVDSVIVCSGTFEGFKIVQAPTEFHLNEDIITEKILSGEYKITNIRPFEKKFGRKLCIDAGFGRLYTIMNIGMVAIVDIVSAT